MSLSVHVEVRGLPAANADGVFARLATSAQTTYTCRQNTRNPAWPNTLLISEEATGNVHLTVHSTQTKLNDSLLGMVVLPVDDLRINAPKMHESILPNGATISIRVETNRTPRINHSFTLAVSTSRVRRRVLMGNRSIQLVMVVFRAAEKGPDWVPIFRGAGCALGNAVFFDDAELDLATACLGDVARPLRIALYRIDQKGKFKMVAFFETAFTALQMLQENKDKERKHAVMQPLQGTFFDETPGNVVFVRVASKEGGYRIAIRFDLFNAPDFISSYARPRRQQQLIDVFDEENTARSRRLESSFSVRPASRVERTTAFEKPPPSYARPRGRSPLRTLIRFTD